MNGILLNQGGAGAVESVNGHTGEVNLTTEDLYDKFIVDESNISYETKSGDSFLIGSVEGLHYSPTNNTFPSVSIHGEGFAVTSNSTSPYVDITLTQQVEGNFGETEFITHRLSEKIEKKDLNQFTRLITSDVISDNPFLSEISIGDAVYAFTNKYKDNRQIVCQIQKTIPVTIEDLIVQPIIDEEFTTGLRIITDENSSENLNNFNKYYTSDINIAFCYNEKLYAGQHIEDDFIQFIETIPSTEFNYEMNRMTIQLIQIPLNNNDFVLIEKDAWNPEGIPEVKRLSNSPIYTINDNNELKFTINGKTYTLTPDEVI